MGDFSVLLKSRLVSFCSGAIFNYVTMADSGHEPNSVQSLLQCPFERRTLAETLKVKELGPDQPDGFVKNCLRNCLLCQCATAPPQQMFTSRHCMKCTNSHTLSHTLTLPSSRTSAREALKILRLVTNTSVLTSTQSTGSQNALTHLAWNTHALRKSQNWCINCGSVVRALR